MIDLNKTYELTLFPSPYGDQQFLMERSYKELRQEVKFPSPYGDQQFLILSLKFPVTQGVFRRFAAQNISERFLPENILRPLF